MDPKYIKKKRVKIIKNNKFSKSNKKIYKKIIKLKK